MTNTELLHRYFDEGLAPEQEQMLFSRLSDDAELRAEFNEHMRLQGMIQSDIRTVTAPSAVTASLYTSLGLGLAGANTGTTPVGTASVTASGNIPRFVSHALTAVVAALLTGVAIVTFPASDAEKSDIAAASDETQLRDERIGETRSAHAVYTRAETSSQSKHKAGSADGRASFAETSPTFGAESYPAATPGAAGETLLSAAVAGRISHANQGEQLLPGPVEAEEMEAVASLNPETSVIERHDENKRAAVPGFAVQTVPEPVMIAEQPMMTMHEWRRTATFLSNLVFEMRLLMSRSWPDVDLPYNSHDLFKDMAISVVYKISENHAFGVEYGREAFGQEYESMILLNNSPSEDPLRFVYTPPAPWIPAVVQRKKMLDWYGLVWKILLPEFGFMNFAFPYARALAGATEMGPLMKMRAGLEMYPTNYSMLNLGIEGSMLHYSIDGAWNNTWKLGVTFGVAVGF